jgi:hypothetical protein
MQLAKYTTAISLFASSALAQWVAIVVPTPGTTITPGSTITVQIGTNIFVENLDISVAIGLQSCPNGGSGCSTADSGIGDVLYMGPFDPSPGPGYNGLYQNYTITIPASTPAGQANLAAADFFLLESQVPTMAFANATITIA